MKPYTITEVYEKVLELEARVLATNPDMMTAYAFERLHDIGKHRTHGPPTISANEMLVIMGGILGVCLRTNYRREAADIFGLLTHVEVRT